ncbi:MAG TPA: PAS domain S-box protein [Bacteroidales bacterium]|nr:PAS domain S-box protein [Bacteroidales bacterium]
MQDLQTGKYSAFFEAAFKSSPNALVISIVEDGTILEANDAFFSLFETSREDVIGRSSLLLNMFANPASRGYMVAEIRKSGMLSNFETVISSRSGKKYTVLISSERLMVDGNHTMLTTIQDVTDRKETESSLRLEHSILDAVISNIGIGFVVSDEKGNIISMNHSAAAIHGFESEAEGLNHLDKYTEEFVLMHTDGLVIGFGQWPLALALKGEFRKNYKVRLLRLKDNCVRIISYNTVPVVNQQDELQRIIITMTDLTEIEQRTKILSNERELFESIFNNIPVMVNIYDPELKNFRFNKEHKNILGWEESDAADGKILEKVYPDPCCRQEVIHYMQSLESGWKEWKATAKNGSIVDSMWANIRLKSGLQIGIGLDITAQKISAEELRENQQRLQGIFDFAAIGIAETDNNDRLVRVNNRLCEILGYTQDELIGKTIYDITCPDDRKMSATLNTQLQEGEMKMFDYQKRYIRKDGNPLWVHVSVTSITDYNGNYVKSIFTVEDISERKAANEALLQSEEKFRSLFENIPEAVGLHEVIYHGSRPSGYKLIETNSAYDKYAALKGSALTEIGPQPGLYSEQYYQVAATGVPYRFETYIPDIQKYFIINIISPRKGYFATVFEDITDHKKTESEIKQKNEELTRFIYTVSHDLKSPLVTIKSFTEYLKEDIESNDKPAQDKDIGFIQNAADKMGVLLDELLNLSRIGRKEDPKSEFLMQDIIQTALDLVAGSITKRNVKVDITGPGVMISGHQQRLIQLYQNLIDNAVKFMGDQKEPLIELGAKIEENRNELILFIKDNGSGIDPRYRHKVFGLFEKLDTGTEGSGIGLAMVKRIVEVHGGTIWFESEGKGKGTAFFFTLDKTRIMD